MSATSWIIKTKVPLEKVTRPREAHEQNGGCVMNKHHPKILAFHIDKLGPEKAPIKTQFGHVPPPDVPIYGMIWIFVPTVSDIPKPCLSPKASETPYKNACIINPPPSSFSKFIQLTRFSKKRPLSEPMFDTSFRHI